MPHAATPDALRARLHDARDAYAALGPSLVRGEPWALATDIGTGPEAAWGPREVLAHVAEMLPFWLGELERVVEGAGGSGAGTPFGRIADDVLRIGVLERDRTLPLRELLARIDAGIARWDTRLAAIQPGEAATVGVHSRLGELRADEIAERFVVGHLEEHGAQLREVLDRA